MPRKESPPRLDPDKQKIRVQVKDKSTGAVLGQRKVIVSTALIGNQASFSLPNLLVPSSQDIPTDSSQPVSTESIDADLKSARSKEKIAFAKMAAIQQEKEDNSRPFHAGRTLTRNSDKFIPPQHPPLPPGAKLIPNRLSDRSTQPAATTKRVDRLENVTCSATQLPDFISPTISNQSTNTIPVSSSTVENDCNRKSSLGTCLVPPDPSNDSRRHSSHSASVSSQAKSNLRRQNTPPKNLSVRRKPIPIVTTPPGPTPTVKNTKKVAKSTKSTVKPQTNAPF